MCRGINKKAGGAKNVWLVYKVMKYKPLMRSNSQSVLKTIIFICVLCILYAFFLFASKNSYDKVGKVIEYKGVYLVARDGTELDVSANKENEIFLVLKRDKRDIAKYATGASKYMRWTAYYDHCERLWFESSDIGGSVLVRGIDGNYFEATIYNTNIFRHMPKQLYDEYIRDTSNEKKLIQQQPEQLYIIGDCVNGVVKKSDEGITI